MIFNISAMKHTLAFILLTFTFAFISCKDLVVTEPSVNTNPADFEKVWSEVNRVYPFFQLKHINWDSVYALYNPLAEKAKGDDGFKILFNLLSILKDCHVSITTLGGKEIETYIPPRTLRDRLTFDPITVRRYFNRELKIAGGGRFEYKMLPDSIGYIRIASFAEGNWINDFDAILDYLRYTKGLIIDVRNNPGGTIYQLEFVADRFVDTTIQYLPYYSRIFSESFPSFYPRGPFTYKNPVAVLINGVSCSASEHFTEIMKQLPNVTAIGDTTAGGGGNGGDRFELPGGRYVQISTADYRRYDGVSIEWNGVPPDITVMQTEEDVKNGHDLQLERAIKLLKEKADLR